MRIELAQIRKYSPSDDIVNEIIYFVYDNIKRNNERGETLPYGRKYFLSAV